jgi:type I restriction enzyme, S subunit
VEVKEGYKQTTVGVFPGYWEVKQVRDFEPFVTSGSRGWAAFYSDRGSPFIRITNLSRSSIYLNLEDLRFVDLPSISSEGARTRLQDGDVLISITADIGIVGYVSNELPKPAYINQHLALVRFDPCLIDPQFVSYFLASESSQKMFRALTDSGAKAGLNLTTVQQIRLVLPPQPEQRAIAEALSDADEYIESLEQLIVKKRHVKQGAIQELLTGKRRLPGFYGEWTVREFGEMVLPRLERVDPIRNGGQEFCVELEHIEPGTGRLVGNSAPGPQSSAKAVFRKDDILFGRLRAYLRKYWLAERDGVCSTEIWVLTARWPIAVPEFVYQLVQTDRFMEKASSAYGTHMPRSDWNVVKKYEVDVPPVKEQRAIAAILSDMDAEIASLEHKLSKARDIREGMSQEVLTGRIRLV